MPPYDSMTSFLGLDSSSHSVDSRRSWSPKSVRDQQLPTISDSNSSDNISCCSSSTSSHQSMKAYDQMETSLTAFFDFVAMNGTPVDNVDKLRHGELMREQKYGELMKELEKYTISLTTTTSSSDNNEGAESRTSAAEAAFFLLLNAWKTLVEYTHVQHQEAYRAYHRGKLQKSQQKSSHQMQKIKQQQQQQEQNQASSAAATRRLSLPNSLSYFRQGGVGAKPAEDGQPGAQKQQQQQRRRSMQALPEVPPVTLVELTKLAEQSCACQTGYILAKKSLAKKIQQQQQVQ